MRLLNRAEPRVEVVLLATVALARVRELSVWHVELTHHPFPSMSELSLSSSRNE